MDEKYVKKVLRILDKEYPEKKVALNHKNSLELLISTILSAQCTDKRVNIVTKNLFKKYKTAENYANSKLEELQNDIRSIGLFRNKAKNIRKTCKLLVEEFNGKVPSKMKDLLKLHGVARKTANIVLSNWFGIAAGIAVDTHVKRISFRLGFTKNINPDKIEQDLMKIIDNKYWLELNHVLVLHGRAVCKAPTPSCSECVLNKICPKNNVTKSN
ncbi:endonuclease III [Candidatus Woesearchaeota archaeon]|jgi:endonuclease-3|nr:endonuclease III [Candidatus Woesearchaeota archaeon]MBT3438353.1 endonuclease III [Candidatus Woesearchaeota archaeon]MBT4058010.1 endonuclease III [Candidatus Woesearchaeota archaeon]MBT4207638.1 endonuclease III [Candidatus Woesearchaeota archaeon]MBT4730599.1 endonuclease III [Candidatus Woesearchaeota archaeon]